MSPAVEKQLAQLIAMRASGEIDEAEFKAAKRYLLEETDAKTPVSAVKSPPTKKPSLLVSILCLFLGFAFISWLIPDEAIQNSELNTPASAAVEDRQDTLYQTAVAAPANSQPDISPMYAPDRDLEEMIEWGKTVQLTASGYPLVETSHAAPVCSNPYKLPEALDAWKANDQKWIDSIAGCIVLPSGTFAEWTRQGTELGVELRLTVADGNRVTLYGPDTGYGGGFEKWLAVHTR